MPSSNSLTTEESVIQPEEQVILWMIDGLRTADIQEALQVSYPDADADACILNAVKHFEQTAGADVTVIRGWCLEAYRTLYQKMVSIGDFMGALRTIKELMAYSLKCSPPNNEPDPDPQPMEPPADENTT